MPVPNPTSTCLVHTNTPMQGMSANHRGKKEKREGRGEEEEEEVEGKEKEDANVKEEETTMCTIGGCDSHNDTRRR